MSNCKLIHELPSGYLPYIPFKDNNVYKPSKCNKDNIIDGIFCTSIYNKVPKIVRKEWKTLIKRENSYYYKNVFEKYAIEYIAAYRIQQWWYKITLSPEYAIGRKFINRKYDEMFE